MKEELENKEIEFKCDCISCGIQNIGDFKILINNGCPTCGSFKIELYTNCD